MAGDSQRMQGYLLKRNREYRKANVLVRHSRSRQSQIS
jgi:hypothetical protein